jgi:hypothetical protein
MEVYFAQFISPMYSEDNEVFSPGYLTREGAEERIQKEVEYYKKNKPRFYQANDWHYSVLELEVEMEKSE